MLVLIYKNNLDHLLSELFRLYFCKINVLFAEYQMFGGVIQM